VHDPEPLQVPPAVAIPFMQLPVLHEVPLAYCSHAAPVVHLPSCPHDAAPWSEHEPLGSAPPFFTLAQVPLVPPVAAAEHAWHWPPHALLQQKPLTQKPLRHWSLTVHAVLWASFARHLPPLHQKPPLKQSESCVQLVVHALPEHL